MTFFNIKGKVPSLKNHRLIVGKKSIPGVEYQAWLPTAQWIARRNHAGEPYKGAVYVEVKTYGLGNDLDGAVQSIVEMMQGIVYENDRQVVMIHAEKHRCPKVDRRVEVLVREVENGD